MGDKIFVTIPLERYEQLTRAEHDANQLKAIIDKAYENYETFNREKIIVLHDIYIGSKEDSKV